MNFFPKLIIQLHPIITLLTLNQLACSLPKTNTTFHQLNKQDAGFKKNLALSTTYENLLLPQSGLGGGVF